MLRSQWKETQPGPARQGSLAVIQGDHNGKEVTALILISFYGKNVSFFEWASQHKGESKIDSYCLTVTMTHV